jgi:hypothetical protein
MEILQIACNVCGRTKGETNHWFIAIYDPRHPGAREFDGIAFGSFDAHVQNPLLKTEHICGEACMHKRLSQWLETTTSPATERQAA